MKARNWSLSPVQFCNSTEKKCKNQKRDCPNITLLLNVMTSELVFKQSLKFH